LLPSAGQIIVGGKFQIGCVTPTSWVIGYRSPRFNWNFRTTDLDDVTADVDYTRRRLKLTAVSGKRGRMMLSFLGGGMLRGEDLPARREGQEPSRLLLPLPSSVLVPEGIPCCWFDR
jgi:hypothetical protein